MRCYRHPDRETGVSCQRCGNLVCWQCQLPNAVGVLCPDCARGAVKRTRSYSSSGRPVLTYTLIGLNVLVYLLQMASNDWVTLLLQYQPQLTAYYPWQMITAGFAHASIMHIALNMYSLYLLGQVLEPMLGKGRFIALYMIALFGGSVAVEVLAPLTGVLGASGAIFGLMGAYFVILRAMGQNAGQITGVIALNLVLGFIPGGNISWQAHVGGLIAGATVAFVYSQTRQDNEQFAQKIAVAAIAVVLVVVAVIAIPA